MALVVCHECSAKVSSSAKSCPHCGAAVKRKTSIGTWLVALALVYGVYAYSPATPPASVARSTTESGSNGASSSSITPATPQWRGSTSTDQISGQISHFAMSRRVQAREKMGFPYGDVQAWVGVGCNSGDEWTYIGFSTAPNLTNSRTLDGFDRINIRARWDDTAEEISLTQEWGAEALHFDDDLATISRLMSSSTLLIELPWFGEPAAYFEFNLDGSGTAISEARRQCETL